MLTYDLNGNLTGDGARQFIWDAAGRLVKINEEAHTSEFTYNGLSQCVRIVEKESGVVVDDMRLLWSSASVVAELAPDGAAVTKLFTGDGEYHPQTFKQYLYNRDELGSIRQVVTPTAEVVAQYDYDPYGRATKVSGDINSAFGYAGYCQHSPTGLNLTWYRVYAPDLGRWLSRDPSGEADGPNLYSYVGGNPVNKIDPLGLQGCPSPGRRARFDPARFFWCFERFFQAKLTSAARSRSFAPPTRKTSGWVRAQSIHGGPAAIIETDQTSRSGARLSADAGFGVPVVGLTYAPPNVNPNFIANDYKGTDIGRIAIWVHEVGNSVQHMFGLNPGIREASKAVQERYPISPGVPHPDFGIAFEECVFGGCIVNEGTGRLY